MNAVFPSVFLRRLWRCRLLLVAVLVFHAATAAAAGVEKTSEFVKGKSKCRLSILNRFYFYFFFLFFCDILNRYTLREQLYSVEKLPNSFHDKVQKTTRLNFNYKVYSKLPTIIGTNINFH